MSASREKKQRQGGTPSNKALAAQQQAEQARRKTIEYTVIAVVVAVLVAALLIWNSGFFQARSTAVTVGSTNYSVAQTSYFYRSTYAYRMMTSYGSAMGFDTSRSPADQTYTTDEETGAVTTYHDFFMDAALEQMKSVTVLYDEAVKNGVTKADVQDLVDQNIAAAKDYAAQNSMSYKQYLTAMYGSFVTPSVFEDCVTRSCIASRGQSDYQDSLTYTKEDLDAYYAEHKNDLDTFKFSYLYFTPEAVETTDEDGNEIERTEEEQTAAEELKLAEAKTKADEAAEAIKDGMSVADAIEEYAPTNQTESAESEGSSVSSIYSDWLFADGRKAGDVTVVENSTNGYYVVVFEDRYLDETPTVNTRHILIEAEMAGTTPTDEEMAAAKAKAEELLNQWKAGDATEASFGELANANSSDRGSNTNGGLYEKVYPGNFVTNYDEWLFDSARQVGDTEIVENRGDYYGYHVVYYAGKNPDYTAWMAKTESLLTQEATSTWLENLTSATTAQAAGGAKYLA